MMMPANTRQSLGLTAPNLKAGAAINPLKKRVGGQKLKRGAVGMRMGAKLRNRVGIK